MGLPETHDSTNPQARASSDRVALGTKAETLSRLRDRLARSEVPPSVSFEHRDWSSDPGAVLDRVRRELRSDEVIVRSSARREDTSERSNAGAFLSVAGVPLTLDGELRGAIDAVWKSYGVPRVDDQVLIQPMLRQIACSGVAMTRTPDLGAPYYVLSFDSASARTDTVTSGAEGDVRTIVLLRGTRLRTDVCPEMIPVLECVQEIEALVGRDDLDIEFALGRNGAVYLLQVRPIAIGARQVEVDTSTLQSDLREAARSLDRWTRARRPPLVGHVDAWSVMADWNPAEMIGTKPSRLAFSLYRHLITDEAWAVSRARLGFRDVRPYPLLVDVLGHPYVDVRADLNSFLPRSIDDALGARLVDAWGRRLHDDPKLHDRVEFEVVPTCVSLDFERHAAELRRSGIRQTDVERLREGLTQTTRATIDSLPRDRASMRGLEERCDRVSAETLPPLDRALLLLEDARRLGFVAFANQARAAFVAMSILRSLERHEAMTPEETESFLASIETVSGRMRRHGAEVARGQRAWADFVRSYGHLRPGTYDIRSPCYASEPTAFLDPCVRDELAESSPWKGLGARSERAAGASLETLGLGWTVTSFERFCREAIEGREHAKFTVTRNVSAALEALAEWGQAHGASREDLSLVPIRDLGELRGQSNAEISSRLRDLIAGGREARARTQAAQLPALILAPDDVFCSERERSEPSFVTRKRVPAPICSLRSPTASANVDGRIVAIPSADPGYDWLFSRPLAGLITMYGGPNSHMAVRAAEFRLPAAIGVGESRFAELTAAQTIDLDCESRRIEILRPTPAC